MRGVNIEDVVAAGAGAAGAAAGAAGAAAADDDDDNHMKDGKEVGEGDQKTGHEV